VSDSTISGAGSKTWSWFHPSETLAGVSDRRTHRVHVGFGPSGLLEYSQPADVVRVCVRQHDIPNVLRFLAEFLGCPKNLFRTFRQSASIRMQPSDDPSNTGLTSQSDFTNQERGSVEPWLDRLRDVIESARRDVNHDH